MSVNKYMHPRNIYKNPPNFKELALSYPEFRQFVKTDLFGKVSFDFKNTEALRALSTILLKKDFDLDVEMPLNKLIPTIPLRLNYILWLEDLLSICKASNTSKQIRGIDIGTGASCIYPLLGAKKNGWYMLATEIDDKSVAYAKNNIVRNSLSNLIEIIPVDESIILKEVIKCENYDFCMCNPPFFGSTQELHPIFKSRKPDRPKPKNSFCASVKEVVVSGGEVDFIFKMISESKDLGEQVNIYTCMIGHKKSLPLLKLKLREVGVKSFKETEFCQGNTTRWGLAWSFCESIDLKQCLDPIKQIKKKTKPKEPLLYKVQLDEITQQSLIEINENVLKILVNLNMTVEVMPATKQSYKYLVKAFSNTWSHQRRKRREILNIDTTETLNSSEEPQTSTSSVEDIEIEINVKSPGKRECDDCLSGSIIKKMKISDNNNTRSYFFSFIITMRMDTVAFMLELDCSMDYNREYLHQILQYIKNHLNLNNDH